MYLLKFSLIVPGHDQKASSSCFFLATRSVSQDLKIVHMEGSYDLDGDGLKEFATVESGSIGGKQKSVIRYYEVNQDGFQEVMWEFEAPDGVLGNFVDVELGDLDGDGSPELITVSNISEENDSELLQPIVFIITGMGFSLVKNLVEFLIYPMGVALFVRKILPLWITMGIWIRS